MRRAYVHKGCRLTLILDSFNLVFWVDPSVKPLADASEILFVSYSSIKFSEGSAFMGIRGRLENRLLKKKKESLRDKVTAFIFTAAPILYGCYLPSLTYVT